VGKERGSAGDDSGASPDLAARAAGHPLRAKLLNLLQIKPGSGATELAHWSHQPVEVVRRQLKLLVDQGLIVVERREPRRGAAENFYARTAAESSFLMESAAGIPEKTFRRSIVGTMRLLIEGASAALAGGTFALRDDWVVTNTQGEVDEQGWRELAELHRTLLDRTQAVLEESKERLSSGDGTPIYAISGQVFIENPSLDPPRP
jgi:hypothetical protein